MMMCRFSKLMMMMMLILLAVLSCLSTGVYAGGKSGGGMSSRSRSGSHSGSGSHYSGSKPSGGKKRKKKKSRSSGSSKMSTRLVKIRKSEYHRHMSYYGKGYYGIDDESGGGRYRGNNNNSGDSSRGGGGKGRGKGGQGKGVFSHDNGDHNQDEHDNENSNGDHYQDDYEYSNDNNQDEVNQDELSTPTPTPIHYVEPPVLEQHFPPTIWPNPGPTPDLFLPTGNAAPSPSSAPSFFENMVNGTPTSTGNVDLDENDPSNPEPLCETTNGVFGSLDGESLTVNFGYELETSQITDEYLMDEVLPALEVQFNDLILPAIFPLTCNATAMAASMMNSRRRRLVVEGISARPDDEPISTDDVSCLFRSFNDSECRLVRGMLTIFVDDYQPSDSAEVRAALKAAMEDNTFESVNPSIRRVGYVDVQDDSEQSPTDPGPGDDRDIDASSSFTDNNSLLVGLVVAGAGGICIAAAAVTYARIARKDAAPDSILGGSTADVQGGESQMIPYDSASIATSASISTSEHQMMSNTTESLLVDPEQQQMQDEESVDDMLDPPDVESLPVNHDGEDLLASTDQEQNTFAT
jgi:hypothetical protein